MCCLRDKEVRVLTTEKCIERGICGVYGLKYKNRVNDFGLE